MVVPRTRTKAGGVTRKTVLAQSTNSTNEEDAYSSVCPSGELSAGGVQGAKAEADSPRIGGFGGFGGFGCFDGFVESATLTRGWSAERLLGSATTTTVSGGA